MCCQVCAKFGDILVKDIINGLGIDKAKKEKNVFRSWEGMKSLFNSKLQMLSEMTSSVAGKDSAFHLLLQKCASIIHTNITKQLDYVQFYKGTLKPDVEKKMC